MDRGEQNALADIEKYGCHIIHVLAENDLPPFSYSVGIQKTLNLPEIIVIGLEQPISHFVINEYNNRLIKGAIFERGEYYSDFIDGFQVLFEVVHKKYYKEYFGWDLWLYKNSDFKVLQLIYPTTSGVWPWDVNASEDFRLWQPILTETGFIIND